MYIVVFVTAKNKVQANTIAKELIRRKLAACVNIIKNVDSIFRWEKKIDSSKEALLIIKSTKAKFKKIEKIVKLKHSYEVPEIIALPIIAGYKPYLRWIDESVR